MKSVKEFVKRYQLILFFILAYIISWAVWIPSITLFYQEDLAFAGVFSPWGAFGLALAGIFITRLIYPEQREKRQKVPLLASFSFGINDGGGSQI